MKQEFLGHLGWVGPLAMLCYVIFIDLINDIVFIVRSRLSWFVLGRK